MPASESGYDVIMSDFFLHENILIRYWVDRCSAYALNGKKIKRAVANIPLSITPDIANNYFEDNSNPMPCEIKWQTSDFKDPDQINTVKNRNGFLLVFDKDRDDCPIPQIEIDKSDFEKWFVKNSSKLAKDTTKKYSTDSSKRKEPRVFLNYLSTSKAGEKNWNIALKHNTWGVNERDLQRSSKEILNVKKGDIILFFYAWTKDKSRKDIKGGRIRIDQYIGSYRRLYALIATKDYYKTTTPKIWTDKEYPHRFKFRKLFDGENIPCNKRSLGARLHTYMHSIQISPRFEQVDSSILLKALSLCTK